VAPTVVTVDGAAGSGKTTLGRRLAEELNLAFIDTGLFYRGVMVAAVWSSADINDAQALGKLAAETEIAVNTSLDDTTWEARVNGRDPGPTLRDPDLAIVLGTISQTPEVRLALMASQRDAAAAGGVAAGRDCGTVVFPHASPKFFLQAPSELRTARRSAQISRSRGGNNETSALQDVVERDAIDKVSLGIAPDAHVIDTGVMSIEEMVSFALGICAATRAK
jgi:cytidylate kinase